MTINTGTVGSNIGPAFDLSAFTQLSGSDIWLGAVNSFWNAGANWSSGTAPRKGSSATIPAGTVFQPILTNAALTGETITLTGGARVNFTNVIFDSTMQGSGTVVAGGKFTVSPRGTIAASNGGTLAVGGGGRAVQIVNNGVISSGAGSLININNGSTNTPNTVLINHGTIAAAGGTVNIDYVAPPFGGNLSPEILVNSGTVAISNGGDVQLNGTIQGGVVAFSGAGTLTLDQRMALSNGVTVTGFGLGDAIELTGTVRNGTLAFTNGTLDVIGTGGTVLEAIPLAGSYGLGNFEMETIGGPGSPTIIAFAPDGGASGVVQPDIIAPATATVTQGSTLSLGNVSIAMLGATSDSVSIDAGSGTLYMNGATGSGTSHLTLGPTPADQINADLASLTYVPAAGSSSDTVTVTATPPAPVSSERTIPITIASASLANTRTSSAAASGTQSVTGSHVDLNTIVRNLNSTLGASSGSGTIQFAVSIQANPQTSAATALTIGPSSISAAANNAAVTMPVNFVPSGSIPVGTTTSGSGNIALSDAINQPIGVSLLQGH